MAQVRQALALQPPILLTVSAFSLLSIRCGMKAFTLRPFHCWHLYLGVSSQPHCLHTALQSHEDLPQACNSPRIILIVLVQPLLCLLWVQPILGQLGSCDLPKPWFKAFCLLQPMWLYFRHFAGNEESTSAVVTTKFCFEIRLRVHRSRISWQTPKQKCA
jgi:hypothetical protein